MVRGPYHHVIVAVHSLHSLRSQMAMCFFHIRLEVQIHAYASYSIGGNLPLTLIYVVSFLMNVL